MKFLRRFCSEQVQILLERMDDHWEEEFDIQESKWDPMLPDGRAFSEYTWIERRCIRFTVKKQEVKLRRERAYTGILERTISPAKTRWEFNSEVRVDRQIIGEYNKSPTYMVTTTNLQAQMEAMLNNKYHQELRKSMLQGITQ
jgi:hypothetical protein